MYGTCTRSEKYADMRYLRFLHYLRHKSMQNSSPKHVKVAQSAMIHDSTHSLLGSIGVQVGSKL